MSQGDYKTTFGTRCKIEHNDITVTLFIYYVTVIWIVRVAFGVTVLSYFGHIWVTVLTDMSTYFALKLTSFLIDSIFPCIKCSMHVSSIQQ